MILGEVVGTVVSTRKCQKLVGYKLLTVRPIYGKKQHDGQANCHQDIFVAADNLGAGIGECVLVSMGSVTQQALDKSAPIDALVVGIVDTQPQIED